MIFVKKKLVNNFSSIQLFEGSNEYCPDTNCPTCNINCPNCAEECKMPTNPQEASLHNINPGQLYI